MLEAATEFVRVNRPVVERVAQALLKKGELDVEDLRELLIGVRPTGDFVQFTWSVELPAMDYVQPKADY